MNRLIGVCAAAALLVVAHAPAGAAARTTRWTVRATLSGTYANGVTAMPAQCAAHYAERVDGLAATFRSTRPIAYDTVARAFTGPLRYRLAGRWAGTRGYVALVPQPDGTLACAAHETPVACSARVVFEDGHRTSTTASARLGGAGSGSSPTPLTGRARRPRRGWPSTTTRARPSCRASLRRGSPSSTPMPAR